MAFFPDLAPCHYFGWHLPPLVAVGWLDSKHDYQRGDPGPQVHERLQHFQQGAWQPVMFCGGHRCELCRSGGYSTKNLFIPGGDVVYVAPEGIVHYVGHHDYLPPAEFCEALLRSPEVDSPDYFAALQTLGWSPSIAAPHLVPDIDRLRAQRRPS